MSTQAIGVRWESPRPASPEMASARPHLQSPSRALTAAVVAAWSSIALGEVSGVSHHVSHGAVAEGTVPPALGLVTFLAGWMVMVAAMMLPSTRPALARLGRRADADRRGLQGRFLSGFGLVWAGAGVAALAFDTVVHEAVEGIPILGARPSLVGAALLALAGALQLAPSTRRALVAGPRGTVSAFRAGTDEGKRCLRADGPLMLVMFGLGMNLAAMVLLTGVMAGQRFSRWGRQLGAGMGVVLLAGAALVAYGPPWLPSLFGAQ